MNILSSHLSRMVLLPLVCRLLLLPLMLLLVAGVTTDAQRIHTNTYIHYVAAELRLFTQLKAYYIAFTYQKGYITNAYYIYSYNTHSLYFILILSTRNILQSTSAVCTVLNVSVYLQRQIEMSVRRPKSGGHARETHQHTHTKCIKTYARW